MPSSHCLKVKVTDSIPARTEFTLNIPQSMGIRIPALGVSTDSAKNGLLAFSKATNGPILAPKSIQNKICSGFCDLDISYGSSYTNTDGGKITIVFHLPVVISAEEVLRVRLPGFTGASNPVITYGISGGTSVGSALTTSSFKIHWDLASTNLIMVAQQDIDANSKVQIDILKDQIALPATALTGDCITDGIAMTSNSSLFNENAPGVDLIVDGSSTAVVIVASNEIVVDPRLYDAITTGDMIEYSNGGGTGEAFVHTVLYFLTLHSLSLTMSSLYFFRYRRLDQQRCVLRHQIWHFKSRQICQILPRRCCRQCYHNHRSRSGHLA